MSFVKSWDAGEVLNLVLKGTLLIDVRARVAYDKGHVRGAINVPLDDLDLRLENLSRDKPIVVYCGNVECTLSYFAAKKLAAKGFNVYRYTSGLKGIEGGRLTN